MAIKSYEISDCDCIIYLVYKTINFSLHQDAFLIEPLVALYNPNRYIDSSQTQ